MGHQTGQVAGRTSQAGKRTPEADYVEAEHDPVASRRASDAAIRQMLGPRIQRNAANAATSPVDAGGVQRAASESGEPLPADVRGRFEASLGADLSGVRVHTGEASASAAEGLNAKAYTTGQDIHFAAGQYDPASKEGQRLLAHEVAHTVQQGKAGTSPQAKHEVSGPADSHEQEADEAADAMIAGNPASVTATSVSSKVQCKGQNDTEQRRSRVPTAAEKRVERMIGILRRQADEVTAELDTGADRVDPALIAHMRRVLTEERGELLAALTNIPSGSDLQMEGFATSNRVTKVIVRLEAIAAAHDGRASVGGADLRGDDRALVFQAAEEVAPAGYCDTAPQRVEPCDLDPPTRDRFRRHVAMSVAKARENWKLAIAGAQVEEKLKKGKLTFEQKLGELLLNALFGVLGSSVSALAAHGLKKLDKVLTRAEWDDEVGVMRPKGLDPDVLMVGQGIVDKGVEKGSAIAQSKLKEGITAQQLVEKAKPPMPSDRESFLASLKTAPDHWHDTIIMSLDRLFDADLASLVKELPLDSKKLSLEHFESCVSELVTMFEQQVQPIGQLSLSHPRPVKVVSAHGVRLALVANERKPNKDLHGEWRSVPVNTGKMTFICWIDDRMKEMAMARARQNDAYADAQMRAVDDATYWDEQSLKRLANEMSSSSPKDANAQ